MISEGEGRSPKLNLKGNPFMQGHNEQCKRRPQINRLATDQSSEKWLQFDEERVNDPMIWNVSS